MQDSRPGIDRLWDDLVNFDYSLFRLETLQAYSGSSADDAFAEWRRTGTVPLTEELRQWRASDGGSTTARASSACMWLQSR